jgi:hypothetical protein
MTAPVRIVPSSWVSVYAGEICVGHVISRGKTGYEALDRDDKSIGLFPGLDEAASALGQLMVRS